MSNNTMKKPPQKTAQKNPVSSILGNTTSIATQNPPSVPREKVVTNTLIRYYLQSLVKELLPDERPSVCLRCLTPIALGVKVLKQADAKRAFYSGLIVCGSVWGCPVCAARITEQRRQELTTALKNTDLVALLATFTLRHEASDPCKTLVAAINEAFRKMKQPKAWREMMDEYGWIGSIRTLEITHGESGFHPHIHELVLIDKKLSKSAQNGLLTELKHKWLTALDRVGRDATWERGVDLRSGEHDIQDYVAKWGHEPLVVKWSLEHELTKAPVKRGRDGGRTMMQLVVDYGDGDIKAGKLFKEYFYAVKGRNQLIYSRGLRERLGLGAEKTDAELAEMLPDNLQQLAFLTRQEWYAVLRADIRGELLHAAGTLSYDDFQEWLGDKLEKWL